MNILVNAIHLDFESPRGIENYAIGIVRGLAKRGNQIYFYTTNRLKFFFKERSP